MAAAAATAVVNPLELVVSASAFFSNHFIIVPQFQLVLTLPSTIDSSLQAVFSLPAANALPFAMGPKKPDWTMASAIVSCLFSDWAAVL
jgi:hypothetical protein